MDQQSARSPRGPYAKSARRRAEIVESAIRVFGNRGYHGGSLREISRELGMSLTAVTHHFPTKETLLEAVLRETDNQALEFDRAAGFVTWVLTLAESNLSRPELLRVFAIVSSEASAPSHPAHDWFVQRYTDLRALVIDMMVSDQASGRMSPGLDPEFLADAVLALWDGLQLQWLIDPRIDMVHRLRQGLDALVRPPSPPRQSDGNPRGGATPSRE